MSDTAALTTDIALPSDGVVAATAERVTQATAVEQARAVAEVHAAIVVAQQNPRNMVRAVEQMRESCRQLGLADRAFYRYRRGGGTVTGESIHLARELARCFGNIQYGISELRRDDHAHESEMQAWAWDVETNTRSSQTFVVPHRRDVGDGSVPLTTLRDVYENNANQGSRRLRQAILAVLPPWYVAEARDLCQHTLENGEGDKPRDQRVATAIEMFEGVGVRKAQLEARHGPTDDWQPHDFARMRVALTSIRQGTVNADDEYPAEPITATEITEDNPT